METKIVKREAKIYVCEYCGSENEDRILAMSCEDKCLQHKCEHTNLEYTFSYFYGCFAMRCGRCETVLDEIEVRDISELNSDQIKTIFNWIKSKQASIHVKENFGDVIAQLSKE